MTQPVGGVVAGIFLVPSAENFTLERFVGLLIHETYPYLQRSFRC
jgi:hypothetical protein